MRILVVHQNFPGQLGYIVRAWAQRPGWDVRGLGSHTAPGLPGFDKLMRYPPGRKVRADQHPYLRQAEESVLHGQAAARAMLELRRSGFRPDVILGHPGWGETLYAKDVFPDARLVHLCEWYYSAEGADVGFDPEFPSSFDDRARIRTWNAQHALHLVQCDAAVSPTHWQRSRHPEILQTKISVVHEGIDVQALGPNSTAAITTPSGVVLRSGDPVITYVARNLEPYRGFHVFMRALESIQKAHASCHAVIVGGDETSYGHKPLDALTWREKMLREVSLDPTRTHFMGRVPRSVYIRVLQVSAAHVYLTYPFVLSWSLLEAMACGAAIVASNTAPVHEVIRDGVNGQIVEFFDEVGTVRAVLSLLGAPTSSMPLRHQACCDAQRYSSIEGILGYDRVAGFHNSQSGRDPSQINENLSLERRA